MYPQLTDSLHFGMITPPLVIFSLILSVQRTEFEKRLVQHADMQK